MAHMTVKSGYRNLVDRLNKFPQGAPASELLYKILKLLFSEKEAELVSRIPIKPFTAKKAAGIWKVEVKEAEKALKNLASRGILLDIEKKGRSIYVLPPPMAGFFEFSMMRIRKDVDQNVLAALFDEYLNVEEEFIRQLFAGGETQQGRIFVNEPAVDSDNALEVLDYERASEVIETATHIGIGMCYCRHIAQHLGRACNAPMEICMTFNGVAASLTRHGIARKVEKQECLELLNKAYEYNLVQFGENVQKRVTFICNCCSCCCEALSAARKFAFLNPIHTANFIPEVNEQKCRGCGKCVEVCPVQAVSLVSSLDPNNKTGKIVRINEEICLGCGVCVRNCPLECLKLIPRESRTVTPVNSLHRLVLMAIERGKLQNLIFDNQAMWNHRAMAAVLGVILKLPPIKQIAAGKQIKSLYLNHLMSRIKL